MKYTLVADGSSDAVLLPILTWSLQQHGVTEVVGESADRGRIPLQSNAEQRLRTVLDLYPCDILFVHRDAETQSPDLRRAEIAAALRRTDARHVPVVPVRMTEAWLLADEKAIRSAAGNPNGKVDLNLPDIRRLESLADPKSVLYAALKQASGLNLRRRAVLSVFKRVHFIPNYIDDYSLLNALPAFQKLQRDIGDVIANL